MDEGLRGSGLSKITRVRDVGLRDGLMHPNRDNQRTPPRDRSGPDARAGERVPDEGGAVRARLAGPVVRQRDALFLPIHALEYETVVLGRISSIREQEIRLVGPLRSPSPHRDSRPTSRRSSARSRKRARLAADPAEWFAARLLDDEARVSVDEFYDALPRWLTFCSQPRPGLTISEATARRFRRVVRHDMVCDLRSGARRTSRRCVVPLSGRRDWAREDGPPDSDAGQDRDRGRTAARDRRPTTDARPKARSAADRSPAVGDGRYCARLPCSTTPPEPTT